MSEFSFKDEETAPETQPKVPPAPPALPVQAAPVAPVAQAPVAVQGVAPQAGNVVSPSQPQAQVPTPPIRTAQAPAAPTPQVPLPQVPLPQVQVPQVQAARVAPNAAAASPPVVPSPALPTAAPAPPNRGGVPSPAAPRQVAPAPGHTPTAQGVAPGTPRAGVAGQPPAAPSPKTAPSPNLPLAGSAARAKESDRNNANMPATGELARAGMKTSAREQVDDKDIPMWRVWLDKLDPLAFWLVRMGAIAGGLALAYLLYAIFSGRIGDSATGNLAQATQNVTLAGTILRFALLAIAVSLIVLMFDEKFVGLGLAVLGVALEFGSPLLIKSLGVTDATNAMALQLSRAGHWLLIMGLLKYSLDAARWLFDLPSRMKQRADVGVAQFAEPAQQRAARNATMFSPCWQLPFCREVIRKQCPAFLAKTACWKFGRGCYCDEEMISRIIRGEALDLIKAPTRMSRQGKPPCGRCYIFLEHQTLKYKLVSPLAIPATIGIMFVGWPAYQRLFGVATQSLGFLWEKLSFGTTVTTTVTETIESVNGPPTTSVSSTISPEYVQQAALNMFGFLIGFFVLIYISKFIEWAIFKAKL